MHSYIPKEPLHHAITYIPFTYSIDPTGGLVALLNEATDYIQMLNPSFDSNTKRFLIESEEPDETFGVIEFEFEEFIFVMMDKFIFETIADNLNLKIYRKGSNIRTSRFSANDFLGILKSMARSLLIDHLLEDLAQAELQLSLKDGAQLT
jgi:hypothetical protein